MARGTANIFIDLDHGPLASIWLAVFYERKLKTKDIDETNIPASVKEILKQQSQPHKTMPLVLSGGLLAGVVRVYARKVSLFSKECNDVLNKIRLAFEGDKEVPKRNQRHAAALAVLDTVNRDLDLDIDLSRSDLLDDVNLDEILDASQTVPPTGKSRMWTAAREDELQMQKSSTFAIDGLDGPDFGPETLEAMDLAALDFPAMPLDPDGHPLDVLAVSTPQPGISFNRDHPTSPGDVDMEMREGRVERLRGEEISSAEREKQRFVELTAASEHRPKATFDDDDNQTTGSADRRHDMNLDMPMHDTLDMDIFGVEHSDRLNTEGDPFGPSPGHEPPSPLGIGGTPNSNIGTPLTLPASDPLEAAALRSDALEDLPGTHPSEDSVLRRVVDDDRRVKHARGRRQHKMAIDDRTTMTDEHVGKWRANTSDVETDPPPVNPTSDDVASTEPQNSLTHLSAIGGSLSLLLSRMSVETARPKRKAKTFQGNRDDSPLSNAASNGLFELHIPNDEHFCLNEAFDAELHGLEGLVFGEPDVPTFDTRSEAAPASEEVHPTNDDSEDSDDELTAIIYGSQLDASVRRTPRKPIPSATLFPPPAGPVGDKDASSPEPLQEEVEQADEESSVGFSNRTLKVLSLLRGKYHKLETNRDSGATCGGTEQAGVADPEVCPPVEISFAEMSKKADRAVAAPSFFELLVLKTRGFVDVQQDRELGSDVKVLAGRRFFTEASQGTPLRSTT